MPVMKLFQGDFSWEIDPELGSSDALYTSLAVAKREGIRLLHERMGEEVEGESKYDVPDGESAITSLTVTISEIITVPITRESFCEILNSGGHGFVHSRKALLKFTLDPRKKRPRVERLAPNKIAPATQGIH